MIEVGNIVTLENNQEYLLLEEMDKDSKKYLYAVRVLEDESLTDEYMIFEGFINGDEEYMKIVDDKELYDELIEEFKEIIAEKVLNNDILMAEADGGATE